MSENFQTKSGLSLLLLEETPDAKEFNALRELMNWRLMSEKATTTALNNSLYSCCVRHHSRLIGFARVIGDGAMYHYVQDVMIHPEFQGQGIGKVIMQRIEDWLNRVQQQGCTMALLAAEGKEGFYKKFGYQERPGLNTGAGMSKIPD